MHHKTVLIVDDDARNIFALAATLKNKGFACVTCSDAMECINMLRRRKDIDVVLMDMMMPEMDGYEAIEVIKRDPVIKPVPVIAVTAQAMKGDREKCLEAGADEYISKPIQVEKLLDVINTVLSDEAGKFRS